MTQFDDSPLAQSSGTTLATPRKFERRPLLKLSDWHFSPAANAAASDLPPVSKPRWIEEGTLGYVAGAPLQADLGQPIMSAMVDYEPSAAPMLTDRIHALLEQLFPILDTAARTYGIPVERVEVTGYVDPEEDNQQVVVTQRVKLPAGPALDYWDNLGLILEDWMRNVPPPLREPAERLSIAVEWTLP